MNKSHLAVLSGFLVSFLFGLTFMFISVGLKYTVPVVLLAYRFAIAFIVMSILIKLKIIKMNLKHKNILPLLLLALINPVINFITEANSLRFIPTIQVAIFLSLVPIVIMILSRILFKEKPGKLQTTFIIVSVLGVIISIIESLKSQTSSSIIGVTLVIITVFTIAFHALLTKHLSSKDYTASEITYIMITTGFIVFTSFSLLTVPIKDIIEPLGHREFVVSVTYLAIGASIIAYGLYNFMYSTISAAATSVFINLTTFVSTIVGVVILNESLTFLQIIGCILIVTGVIATNIIEYLKQ